MAVSDAWLPRPSTFRVLPLNCKIPTNFLVADLINQQGRSWNLSLLRRLVYKDDLDVILSIPLSWTDRPDEFGTMHQMRNSLFVQRII